MKTYEIILSNGGIFTAHASSAADAIQVALLKNIGKTVKRCSCPGFEYEVPPHKPYAPQPKRSPAETLPMFDESKIKLESEAALRRAGK